MRPKKKILLVDSSDFDLSLYAYLLNNAGYKIFKAKKMDEAVEQFTACEMDMVVTTQSETLDSEAVIRKLKAIASHVPMVIMGDVQKMIGKVHSADALLNKRGISSAEFLERVKIMSARKRGPRKGTVKRPSALSACLA